MEEDEYRERILSRVNRLDTQLDEMRGRLTKEMSSPKFALLQGRRDGLMEALGSLTPAPPPDNNSTDENDCPQCDSRLGTDAMGNQACRMCGFVRESGGDRVGMVGCSACVSGNHLNCLKPCPCHERGHV